MLALLHREDPPFLMIDRPAGLLAAHERLQEVVGDPHDLGAGLEAWTPTGAPQPAAGP